jgi:hypothetical protein
LGETLDAAGNLTYISALGKVTTIDWTGAAGPAFDPCYFAGIAA